MNLHLHMQHLWKKIKKNKDKLSSRKCPKNYNAIVKVTDQVKILRKIFTHLNNLAVKIVSLGTSESYPVSKVWQD